MASLSCVPNLVAKLPVFAKFHPAKTVKWAHFQLRPVGDPHFGVPLYNPSCSVQGDCIQSYRMASFRCVPSFIHKLARLAKFNPARTVKMGPGRPGGRFSHHFGVQLYNASVSGDSIFRSTYRMVSSSSVPNLVQKLARFTKFHPPMTVKFATFLYRACDTTCFYFFSPQPDVVRQKRAQIRTQGPWAEFYNMFPALNSSYSKS